MPLIKQTCKWCECAFVTYPSQLRAGKGKFCSKRCVDFWQSEIKTVGRGALERKNSKRRARDTVRRALKSGKLIRELCEMCVESKVEAHHDDYHQPLNVRWLCQKHHREVDLKLGVRYI